MTGRMGSARDRTDRSTVNDSPLPPLLRPLDAGPSAWSP